MTNTYDTADKNTDSPPISAAEYRAMEFRDNGTYIGEDDYFDEADEFDEEENIDIDLDGGLSAVNEN